MDDVLRCGVLFKKGSGVGTFARKNWKPRYFVLTATTLRYYTYEGGELKGALDLTGCTDESVEKMPADALKTGSSASTIWRIALNCQDRRLLLAANTEPEMHDWIDSFKRAFRTARGLDNTPGLLSPLSFQQTHFSQPSNQGPFGQHWETDIHTFTQGARASRAPQQASSNPNRHSNPYPVNQTYQLSQEQPFRKSAPTGNLHETGKLTTDDLLTEQRRQKKEKHEKAKLDAEMEFKRQEALRKAQEASRFSAGEFGNSGIPYRSTQKFDRPSLFGGPRAEPGVYYSNQYAENHRKTSPGTETPYLFGESSGSAPNQWQYSPVRESEGVRGSTVQLKYGSDDDGVEL